MKRRTFVKNTLPLVALPGLVKGVPLGALTWPTSEGVPNTDGKILVMIELNGGNDGLNTIIPIDQYKNLRDVRGNILIPENRILPLSGTNIVGLHPSLKPLQALYDRKMMTVVQGVGYPNFNYSHFRASDILQTSSGADNSNVSTGFLGRYLNKLNPQYPKGYPNNQSPDPLAITVGPVPISTMLQGNTMSMGLSISSSSSFYNLVSGVSADAPLTNAGKEVNFMRRISSLTTQYEGAIKQAGQKQQNLSGKYPEKNEVAENLKIIAQLIGGGLQTSVYVTTQFNYDHHNAQVDTADPTKGKHAGLLSHLAEAIDAFLDDLQLMGMQDRVLCMVYSEFGRRIKSNASYGTDHGSAQPFMFFGTQLKSGFIGHNPVIHDNITVADNLEMQNDYRSVYTTILKKWFNASDDNISASVLATFPQLDLFK